MQKMFLWDGTSIMWKHLKCRWCFEIRTGEYNGTIGGTKMYLLHFRYWLKCRRLIGLTLYSEWRKFLWPPNNIDLLYTFCTFCTFCILDPPHFLLSRSGNSVFRSGNSFLKNSHFSKKNSHFYLIKSGNLSGN